jgi:hypothetical protein
VTACAIAACAPAGARAQDLVPGLAGGAAGFAAGGYVTLGIWTAKARWRDEYLYSPRDVLGWESLPVLVGTVAGASLGAADQDRLRRGVVGGAAGWLVGTGVGAILGAASWPPPEGRWAGAVVGGAAGVVLGSAVGLLWPADDGNGSGAGPGRTGLRGVPLAVVIRF